MSKILTISIASYNVAAYLRGTLDSLIDPRIMEDLEVLIVNDGSRDETAAIAREYEARFPGTFRLIDKENGGYGTTVNASMKEARGRYFKLLDGDDWYRTEGLVKLVGFLRTCEADLVLTKRTEVVDETGEEFPSTARWVSLYGKKYNRMTVDLADLEPFIYGMWVAAYRTSMLREHPFTLPAHQLYTDRLYVCYPLPWIRTVAFLTTEVYRYRIGREEQSVSNASRMKHIDDLENGFDILLDWYRDLPEIPAVNDEFLKLRIARHYNGLLEILIMLPASRANMKKIREIDRKIKEISPALYKVCGQENRMLRSFRRFGYHLYWLRKLKKARNTV